MEQMNKFIVYMDCPREYQLGFQDSACSFMHGVVDLHNYIMLYLIVLGILVALILLFIAIDSKNNISNKYFYEDQILEYNWTLLPVVILLCISIPSFELLSQLDSQSNPYLTVKVIGLQWYWSVEISDTISFDSYVSEEGSLRLLDVDNRIILPAYTPIQFIVTGGDVIHSFAIPSFGLKLDAIPGRLNSTHLVIDRTGTFYGQCSELCGVLHHAMPIAIEVI